MMPTCGKPSHASQMLLIQNMLMLLIRRYNLTEKEELLEKVIFYLLEHSKSIDDFVSACKLMGLKQNTMLDILKIIVNNNNTDGGIKYVPIR